MFFAWFLFLYRFFILTFFNSFIKWIFFRFYFWFFRYFWIASIKWIFFMLSLTFFITLTLIKWILFRFYFWYILPFLITIIKWILFRFYFWCFWCNILTLIGFIFCFRFFSYNIKITLVFINRITKFLLGLMRSRTLHLLYTFFL